MAAILSSHQGTKGSAGPFSPGERVWLDVDGRHVPAVVVGVGACRVLLRVQRVDRWDVVRVVRGRAKVDRLSHRDSVYEVDRRGRS